MADLTDDEKKEYDKSLPEMLRGNEDVYRSEAIRRAKSGNPSPSPRPVSGGDENRGANLAETASNYFQSAQNPMGAAIRNKRDGLAARDTNEYE